MSPILLFEYECRIAFWIWVPYFYSLTTGLDYLLLRCTGTTRGRIQVCVKQQVYIKSEGSLVRGKLFGKSAKNGVNAQNWLNTQNAKLVSMQAPECAVSLVWLSNSSPTELNPGDSGRSYLLCKHQAAMFNAIASVDLNYTTQCWIAVPRAGVSPGRGH